MEKLYMLLTETNDGQARIAQGSDGHNLIAMEGDQYLLEEMGEQGLEAGFISSYVLIAPAGPVVRKQVT